jgi:glucokinase
MRGRTAVGVDIGGTGIKIGLVTLDPVAPAGEPRLLFDHARNDPDLALDAAAATIRELTEAAGLVLTDLAGIGLGCAGLIDATLGLLHTSPNLPAWRNVRLKQGMEARLGAKVTVLNDAEAFLIAEWREGVAKGADDALFLTIGTGVGGGLVLGGRPYRGASGLAGEIGHMSVDVNGEPCPCGNRGCLERYVARGAIERLAVKSGLAAEGADSPKGVFERASAGDPRALNLFAEIGRRLGAGLAGPVNLLEPRLVVVGGGIAASASFILPRAELELASRSMVARTHPVPIRAAQFGPVSGLVGAALAACGHDDPR